MDLIFPKKLEELQKALVTFHEALNTKSSTPDLQRDACVLRFIYTSELFWKTLKVYLREEAQVDTAYPKETARQLRNIKVFSDEETEVGLQMIEDRNFCVHAYQEAVAEKIFRKTKDYYSFMQQTLSKI